MVYNSSNTNIDEDEGVKVAQYEFGGSLIHILSGHFTPSGMMYGGWWVGCERLGRGGRPLSLEAPPKSQHTHISRMAIES